MGINLTRRRLLYAIAGLTTVSWLDIDRALATPGPPLAAPEPFSFERLRERARQLARRPFEPAPPRHPKLIEAIDYDTYQQIQFRRDSALWASTPGAMPVEFFHLGRYANKPVVIYVVEDGRARQVRYSPRLFDYGNTGLRTKLPDDLGFAGFHVLNPGERQGDWLAFMGASYFRSSGPLHQYGLSARGIAVDTVVPGQPEEFPRFTALWLQQPREGGNTLTVYALLEGESITGAYRFECRKDAAVVMDVHAQLFQREDIAQLGIAPLTSMYWYSETNHRRSTDWRPEIHDSDGLAMWTGKGERIWRPLNSPPYIQTNAFLDHNPKGFGLLQRDRNFDHYQDDGVFYNRRPSVWVEPMSAWGEGAVYLLEMPTNDEIQDNIVAFWVPARAASKGTSWNLDYRLYWVATEPYIPDVGRVVATRIGRSGIPGQHETRPPNARKFVIDFTGGPLAQLRQRYDVQVIAETSRGAIDNAYALKVVGTDLWRAFFDLRVDGKEAVDLRCYLRLGERTLTETWIYQYFPGNYGLQLAGR
ncbi:MAG: glucan biosynthesis protein [Nitrococcus sp.]|nr:glucan biosynthesis protein [Nitrococcus sp.]